MKKTIVALLLCLSILPGHSNDLIKYYYGEITLTSKHVDSLCNQIIVQEQDQYLLALAHYQKGVLLTKTNGMESYSHYDMALEYFLKTDIEDDYLLSAILRNQGAILHDYGLYEYAVKKHEEAIDPAYAYSDERGLAIKFNLGWALEKHDKNRALDIFKEVIEEAYDLRDYNRSGKSFLEVSKILNALTDYEKALEFSNEAIQHVENTTILAQIYHNKSHTYFLMENYRQQQLYLLKSLDLREGKDRFISLMDLGESYLISGDTASAKKVLEEAYIYYDEQYARHDNFKLFEWLYQTDRPNTRYLLEEVKLLNQYADTKENLEKVYKQQAMYQLLLRLEKQREAKKKLEQYRIYIIIAVIFSFGFAILAAVWWYRARKKEKNTTLLKVLAEKTKSTLKMN